MRPLKRQQHHRLERSTKITKVEYGNKVLSPLSDETKTFETDTETFFRDQKFLEIKTFETETLKIKGKSLDTKMSQDEISHSEYDEVKKK